MTMLKHFFSPSWYLLCLMLLFISSSGGGSPSASGNRTGGVRITIQWDARSDGLVLPANSLKIEAFEGMQPITSIVLPRPPADGPVSVVMEALPVGAITLRARGYSGNDGTGVELRQATIPLTIRAGKTSHIALTTDRKIDHLTLVSPNSTLYVGAHVALTLTAYNAAGEVILLPFQTLEWKTEKPGLIVEASGQVQPLALAVGSATITVRERESGKQASVSVTIQGWRYSVTEVAVSRGQAIARDINDEGAVVGQVNGPDGPIGYLWTPGQGMVNLGNLSAAPGVMQYADGFRVNSQGQVVGVSSSPKGIRAFLWDSVRGMQNLGAFGPAWDGTTTVSEAYGINDKGQVVGYSSAPSGQRAFLWDPVKGMQNLGALGTGSSPDKISSAVAINEKGQVAGWASDKNGMYACLWDRKKGMQSLGALGVDQYGRVESIGAAINDLGQVVGASTSGSGEYRNAFLWTAQAGMKSLGVLGQPPQRNTGPPVQSYSSASDINNQGQIVGTSTSPEGGVAFLWTQVSGMLDLNKLIPPGSGWRLMEATAINRRGQIVGNGFLNGIPRVFLLTPQGI